MYFLSDASPELLYWFSEQTLQPGPTVSLKCVATGNPPPQFTWTLDGFPVRNHLLTIAIHCTRLHHESFLLCGLSCKCTYIDSRQLPVLSWPICYRAWRRNKSRKYIERKGGGRRRVHVHGPKHNRQVSVYLYTACSIKSFYRKSFNVYYAN